MAGLKDNIEALTVVAQEQALGIKSIEAEAYYTKQDLRCRLFRGLRDSPTHNGRV